MTTNQPSGFSAPAAETMAWRRAVASAPSECAGDEPNSGSRRRVSAASRPISQLVARYSKLSSSTLGAVAIDDRTMSAWSAGRYCPITAGRQRIQSTLSAPIPPSSSRPAAKRAGRRSRPSAASAVRTSSTAVSNSRQTFASRW